MRGKVLSAVGLLLFAAALFGGGYALGEREAPTQIEAARDEREARRAAYLAAYRRSSQAARREGFRAGRRAGLVRGSRVGRTRGARAGERAGQAQRAQQAQAAEAQRQQAIEARTQERAENCGAELFVEGYCPSDEEVQREEAAESLCGPGTAEGREEAARRGIQC